LSPERSTWIAVIGRRPWPLVGPVWIAHPDIYEKSSYAQLGYHRVSALNQAVGHRHLKIAIRLA